METEVIGVAESLWHLVAQYALNVVGALALLVFGWTAAAWAQRYVRNALERAEGVDATLRPLIAGLVRYTVIALVVIAVLAQFGVQTTSIIAVLGTAGGHRPRAAGHAVQRRRRRPAAVPATDPCRRVHRGRRQHRNGGGDRPVRHRAAHHRRCVRVRA